MVEFDVLTDLLPMIDNYIRFKQAMTCCMELWDVRNLFSALVFYREMGCHDTAGLSDDKKPIYHLLAASLRAQIMHEDPGWFTDEENAAAAAEAVAEAAARAAAKAALAEEGGETPAGDDGQAPA